MEQKFSVLLYIHKKTNITWLKRSIKSILSGTILPNEIIAVIFGKVSQEAQNILLEAQKHINLQIISASLDYGRVTVLKMALSKCSNELVAMQDVDTISLPHRFERQLEYFSEHPEVSVLGGWNQEIDNDTLLPLSICDVSEKQKEIKNYLRKSASLICHTVMFKKSAVLDIGGYKDFPMFENEYLWPRLIGKGYKIAILREILIQGRYNVGRDEILAFACYHMKKELFSELCDLDFVGPIAYYWLVCWYFVKYMILPNWLKNLFHRERLILD